MGNMEDLAAYKTKEHVRKQTLLDDIAAYALTMTRPSVDSEGACVYRNEAGNKCFFGGIIPDELYEPSMETQRITQILSAYPRIQQLWEEREYSTDSVFLQSLQNAHDNQFDNKWTRLREIASQLNLTLPLEGKDNQTMNPRLIELVGDNMYWQHLLRVEVEAEESVIDVLERYAAGDHLAKGQMRTLQVSKPWEINLRIRIGRDLARRIRGGK